MGGIDSFFKKNGKKIISSNFLHNLSASGNKLLYNQIVLYFIFAVSLLNLIYLAVDADYVTIAVYLLIGFITSHFSKNMVVILFMSLTISNMLRIGLFNRMKEGYDNTPDLKDDTDDTDNDGKKGEPVNPANNKGDTCQGNNDCRSTEYCSNDVCTPKCTKNSNCGDTEYCNNGVCVSNPSS